MSINGYANSLKEQSKNLKALADLECEPAKGAQIRDLNDRLRQTGSGGTIQITSGLAALGPDLVFKVLAAVTGFDGFTPDNDPWGEHDCGLLTVEQQTILWKVDYYDLTRSCLSPDPADPKVTVRVLTVMRAEEY
jgi:Protein of unknown function (DUF3768)